MKTIGPFDYNSLHVLFLPDGKFQLFERRRKMIVVSSTGHPRRLMPPDTPVGAWPRYETHPRDQVTDSWVLIPVAIRDED